MRRTTALLLLVAFLATGCSASEPAGRSEPTGVLVEPATRDPDRWGDARANDGTPFGFGVSLAPDGSSEWVIYLQGGGFCDDWAMPCTERGGHNTSPPGEDGVPITLPSGGIFSRDPSLNPAFWDANHAFAFYSSSDGWSGATTERRPTTGDPEGWYFSGRVNFRRMVEVLIADYGLDDTDPATRVLLAGSSAGGSGAMVNVDQAVELLPTVAAEARLIVVNDGGAIFDFEHPGYLPGAASGSIAEVAGRAFEFWGASYPQVCETAHAEDPWRCAVAPVLVPYLTSPPPKGLGVPVLIQTSLVDSYQLDLHGIDDPQDPSDRAAYKAWRDAAVAALAEVPWLFAGTGSYHTILTRSEEWSIGPPGSTFREVLVRFWDGAPPERVTADG